MKGKGGVKGIGEVNEIGDRGDRRNEGEKLTNIGKGWVEREREGKLLANRQTKTVTQKDRFIFERHRESHQ